MIRRGLFARRALAFSVLVLCAFGVLAITAGAQDNRTTELLSVGPLGGNGPNDAAYGGTSADGTHVFFTTAESLTSDDTDGGYTDVYERFNGVTTLVSTGPTGGSGAYEAVYAGCSADGSHVYFETNEPLTSSDTDTYQDVYDRSGGTTTELSIGPVGGNGLRDAFFIFNSTDGSRVYFETYEQLTSNDTDAGYRDVYLSSGGTTSLVSTGPIGGSGPYGAQIDGITPDGSNAYFHTDEALVSSDTDGGAQDVYDRVGSTTTRVSTGPLGGNTPGMDAFFENASQDGSHVFFSTSEPITSSDTDTMRDLYDRSGGTTTEVSLGPNGGNGPYNVTFGGSNPDGSHVWFTTREALVSGDTDGGCQEGTQTVPCYDIYEYSGGNTTWISSGGNGSYDAAFDSASDDGSKVFFHTNESLSPADTDSSQDVYQRSGGTTTLLTGPGNYGAYFAAASSDGARVFFYTYESLVSADNDGNSLDVYERYGGEFTLISTGPASANEATAAIFSHATADGTKVFFFTGEKLTSGDTDSTEDVYSSTTAPTVGYARPKGATPTRIALVPAYQPCTGPGNRTHGAPFDVPSCAPPTQTSSVLTVGTGDANGFLPQSISSVRYIVNPSLGDVTFVIAVNDVRCQTTNAACPGGFGSPYNGNVLVSSLIRATDKFNGSPPVESATVSDFPVQVPVGCVTVSSTTGAACNLTTTENALVPGAITANNRTIWQLDDVKVMDAGPNGTGYGAGCPPTCGDGDEGVFMRSGIFTP